MKLKWKVPDKPTGRYRSFQRRGWPGASYVGPNQRPAVMIQSEDDYVPARAKTGAHTELVIMIADYSLQEDGRGFKWRRLKARAKTLAEAKKIAEDAIVALPNFQPKEF